MTHKSDTKDRKSFLQLLAKGRFAEAEKIMINNPNMRKMVLHLPGLRHTRFFKERIRFYREYARKNKMVGKLRGSDRDTLRHEFAQSHCKLTALSKACKKLLDDCPHELKKAQEHIKRLQIQRIRNRRKRRLGLF